MADTAALLDRFARFWVAYPKKVAKADARKAWLALAPDEALLGRMVSALAWQRLTPQWSRDDGQYIPYPATWLRAERWDDEPFHPPAEAAAHAPTRDGYTLRSAHTALEALYAHEGRQDPANCGPESPGDRDARENGTGRVRRLH